MKKGGKYTVSRRQWKEKTEKDFEISIESVQNEITYNNHQLEEDFLPKYNEMLNIFRNGYWLAEPETKAFYPELIEYVEGWSRWKNKGITPETIHEIGHSEENLKPFYKDLETQTEMLRLELASRGTTKI